MNVTQGIIFFVVGGVVIFYALPLLCHYVCYHGARGWFKGKLSAIKEIK